MIVIIFNSKFFHTPKKIIVTCLILKKAFSFSFHSKLYQYWIHFSHNFCLKILHCIRNSSVAEKAKGIYKSTPFPPFSLMSHVRKYRMHVWLCVTMTVSLPEKETVAFGVISLNEKWGNERERPERLKTFPFASSWFILIKKIFPLSSHLSLSHQNYPEE